jgi:hypothetical protein
MNFRQFLAEATVITSKWKVSKVNVKRGIELLNEHCRKSLSDVASSNVLFRGFKQSPGSSVMVFDSTAALRTSKDSSNLYQLAMDISSNLKGVPKRSASFICSSDMHYARQFSHSWQNLYVMLPFDGTPVAVSREDDFINKNLTRSMDIEYFDSFLRDALYDLGIKPDKQSKYISAARINAALAEKSPEAIIYSMIDNFDLGNIDDVDDAYNKASTRGSMRNILSRNAETKMDMKLARRAVNQSINPTGSKLLALLRDNRSRRLNVIADFYMDPKVLRLSVQLPGELRLMGEAWFSGQCVGISVDTFYKILQEPGIKVGSRLKGNLGFVFDK